MTKDLFFKFYHDAQDQPDLETYIAEYGYPDYFDEISDDPEKVVAKLSEIHRLAHMSIRELIAAAGMTQAGFAKYFDIPLRTLENWCGGSRACKEYDKIMFAELLGIIEI